jgi:hypothetical protein
MCQLNVTQIVDLPGNILGTLVSDAQHAIGIHDFYRYGLWGYCDGFNDTVVYCTPPKPGNGSNPIAAINKEITHNLRVRLPNSVQTRVDQLNAVSLFIFSCWIVGATMDFVTLVVGLLVGQHSRLTGCLVGALALVRLHNESALTPVDRLLLYASRFSSGASHVFLDGKCTQQRRFRLSEPQGNVGHWNVCLCVDKFCCQYYCPRSLERIMLLRGVSPSEALSPI